MRSYELTFTPVGGRTSARDASLVRELGCREGWSEVLEHCTCCSPQRFRDKRIGRPGAPSQTRHEHAPEHKQMGQPQHRRCQARFGVARRVQYR
jgi:hypothetical protein